MRLIHTSDWHLGRTFHRVGLHDEQARFLDSLVESVRSEKVDVVVVAGDVYDRALPAVDTVALLDDAVVRLREAGAQVVISSGNHDSAGRLGFAARVLAVGGVHVRTDPARIATPVELSDEHGPIAIYAVPYLEPHLVGPTLGLPPDGNTSHQQVLGRALDLIRADLVQRPASTRSIVAAHAFVVGGQPSDSERDISVGGVAAVPTSVFEGIDYVALGHLHGRAAITDTIRYSGSPIAYSFSEVHQVKGSWLVDLDQAGVRQVEFLAAPVSRPLATLRGSLEDLLTDPAHRAAQDAYCQITLTDAERPRAAMEQLRRRFPHTLVLAFDPQGAATSLRDYAARVRGRSDLEVCCDFLAHVRGGSAATEEEQQLLSQALEAVREQELTSEQIAQLAQQAELTQPGKQRDVGAA